MPRTWQGNYQAIDTAERLAAWLRQLAAQSRLAVRVIGTSSITVQAEVAALVLAWTAGEAWYLPLEPGGGAGQLDRAATLAALRPILENEGIEKISRDAKHDMVLLAGAGIEPRGFVFDTMLASYLLDAGERNHTLGELAQRYLEHSMSAPPQMAAGDDPAAAALLAAQTAGEEIDVTLRLAPILTKRLQEENLERLLVDLEMPLAVVLADMERTGIRVDTTRLATLERRFRQQGRRGGKGDLRAGGA